LITEAERVLKQVRELGADRIDEIKIAELPRVHWAEPN
jgi:hypothetical protein